MKNKTKISCLPPITITLIFLAFFFAKIFNYIDWSWWLVFSPLWIPFFSIPLLFIIIYGILWIFVIITDLILEKPWK